MVWFWPKHSEIYLFFKSAYEIKQLERGLVCFWLDLAMVGFGLVGFGLGSDIQKYIIGFNKIFKLNNLKYSDLVCIVLDFDWFWLWCLALDWVCLARLGWVWFWLDTQTYIFWESTHQSKELYKWSSNFAIPINIYIHIHEPFLGASIPLICYKCWLTSFACIKFHIWHL